MLFFLKIKHHNLNGADDIVIFNDQFKNSMFNSLISFERCYVRNIFTTFSQQIISG